MNRDELIFFLERLSAADFERVLTRIPDADRLIAGVQAPLATRTSDLIRYVESETGPGLPFLNQLVTSLFPVGRSLQHTLFLNSAKMDCERLIYSRCNRHEEFGELSQYNYQSIVIVLLIGRHDDSPLNFRYRLFYDRIQQNAFAEKFGTVEQLENSELDFHNRINDFQHDPDEICESLRREVFRHVLQPHCYEIPQTKEEFARKITGRKTGLFNIEVKDLNNLLEGFNLLATFLDDVGGLLQKAPDDPHLLLVFTLELEEYDKRQERIISEFKNRPRRLNNASLLTVGHLKEVSLADVNRWKADNSSCILPFDPKKELANLYRQYSGNPFSVLFNPQYRLPMARVEALLKDKIDKNRIREIVLRKLATSHDRC